MIPEKYQEYFHTLGISKSVPLKENNACLHLKAKVQVYYVDVDKGILKNAGQGEKRCDFLLWDEINKAIVLIELKGEDIDSALDQLKQTFTHLSGNKEFDFMTQDLKYLFACCASSNSKIPKGINSHERKLCNFLKRKYHGTYKIKDGSELLIYVRCINGKLRTSDDSKRNISVAGNLPLPIYPQIWEKYLEIQDETNSENKYQHN